MLPLPIAPARASLALAATASLALLVAACSGGRAGDEPTGSSGAPVTTVCGASAGSAVQGADVSVFQGAFSWSGRGLDFGYARISDGTGYIDPDFDGNWSRMHADGILRGAYQFFEPGEDEVAQANFMVQEVGHLGEGDLPAMIDVEVTGGQSGGTIAAKVRRWLQIVEAGTGRKPVIYTGSYFWQDNVGDTSFGSYPLWIAAYGPACPPLPPGWATWTFWQYSDGGGSLDHDVFNGSLAQLKSMAGASGPPTAKPKAPSGCGEIGAGEGLAQGESFSSCDGRFSLAMQTDGNLVLYWNGVGALWASHTNGTDGYVADVQTDGNVVVYGKTSNPLWATGTEGHAGASLAVQDDGNLVVYSAAHTPLWASNTSLPAAPPAPQGCGAIAPGEGLVVGDAVKSCDGRFSLAMQTDGNLVLYGPTGARWATGTAGTSGYVAIAQTDGNFVVYDRSRKAIWSSRTNGHAIASLDVQSDGNLVLYAPGGKAYWATGTNE